MRGSRAADPGSECCVLLSFPPKTNGELDTRKPNFYDKWMANISTYNVFTGVKDKS